MHPGADARGAARTAWERLSARYQEHHELPTEDVQYGAWAPSERALGLLGDVRSRRVLDIGCGGGQNCIALARQGAIVTGLDFSAAQLAYAQRLAAKELGQEPGEALRTGKAGPVEFVQGAAEELAGLPDEHFDLLLSVNTLQYVGAIGPCLAACRRVLRRGGRLVVALDHPLRACFFEDGAGGEDEEPSIIPARSYYDRRPRRWQWGSTGILLQTYHRTIGEWSDLLAAAPLRLLRLVEPQPPAATLDALWPADGALAPLRCVPHVLLLVAQKE